MESETILGTLVVIRSLGLPNWEMILRPMKRATSLAACLVTTHATSQLDAKLIAVIKKLFQRFVLGIRL